MKVFLSTNLDFQLVEGGKTQADQDQDPRQVEGWRRPEGGSTCRKGADNLRRAPTAMGLEVFAGKTQ